VGDIVEIRKCRRGGLSKAATARQLGIDRKTVAKYWDGPSDEPEKPRYNRRSHKIDPYQEYITKRLEMWPELSAERIYQEIAGLGFTGSRRTVRRYVAKIRPPKQREHKPIETLPGEQAQVDWGHLGRIQVNSASLPLYAFVLCLSWSRVRYVEFITSLNMATFAACLHRAFEYVGGVPRQILFDNAKIVVSERVGGVVRYNEQLLRMAALYGFEPRACWIRDPESKGKVESNVKYVKHGFYYGREYTSLQDLNRQARNWLDTIANTKIHGTTGKAPFKRLSEEKRYLKPLDVGQSLYIIEERMATKTGLISIEGNRYSVPAAFARRKVRYRRYEDRIEILDGDKVIDFVDLVAGRGQQIILDRHYPQHNQEKTVASHPLQAKFEGLAPSAKKYLQGLSQARVGHLREQMEQIIALTTLYSKEELEAAMKRSLDFNAYGYGRLKKILERQKAAPGSLPQKREATPSASPEMLAAVGSYRVQKRDLSYYGGVVQ
jgi:transposase